jgi:hypothetical protein
VDRCVKLRGLPWEVSKTSVVQFFSGFEVGYEDITIGIDGGRYTGDAVV